MLIRSAEFDPVGEASSGPEAITVCESLHPDLVLMDVNLPGMNGIDASGQILATQPDVTVILCSTHRAVDLLTAAESSGARAYIHKERLGVATLRAAWEARRSVSFTVV